MNILKILGDQNQLKKNPIKIKVVLKDGKY